VIGGGDWAVDRIVPDCIRAFNEGRSVELRNPLSTRPWQHVLEPLGGYLLLASRLLGKDGAAYCSGWNFGPVSEDVRPVEDIVRLMAKEWGGDASWSVSSGTHVKEASKLSLNCDKATGLLDWRPCWSLEQLVKHTVSWFRVWNQDPAAVAAETKRQIALFEAALVDRQVGGRLAR
jgi:CDP-glucose 4,6-dehydratase